jgi:hypothetical protein
MILPSKHLRQEHALLGVGAVILRHLEGGRTVSEVWERTRQDNPDGTNGDQVSFDWFLLALSLLYAIHAIELENGLIRIRSAA